MAKRPMKNKCPTTLIFGETQIKTTMRYHLTSVRTAIIKKPTNKKSWRGSGEEGSLLHSWWEWKWVWPPWRTAGGSLKNWKQNDHRSQQSHYWACTLRKPNSKRHLHPSVHRSTLYSLSTDRWIDKTHRVGHDWSDLAAAAAEHICNEYYSAIKKMK